MEFIGYIAAFCTTVAFIPQAVKVYKTNRTKDLSLGMFGIFSFGVFCWLMYGLYIEDVPVIAANMVTFVLAFYILVIKVKNLKKDKESLDLEL